MSFLAIIAISFLGVFLTPFLCSLAKTSLVPLIPAVLFCLFIFISPHVFENEMLFQEISWIPSLGINISMRLDALSLLFGLLITGIGTFVFLFSTSYMKKNENKTKFFTSLTLFMAAMLGVVLSDNLILLVAFWELTSISSFLLIGFEHEKIQARNSAQQGFLITVSGGLALTAAAILIGNITGTYQLSELIKHIELLTQSSQTPFILFLLLYAAFTKSAQMPLHIWLPNAMVAPTPVSAYLHSATMVKLGIFLLMRFKPIFGSLSIWISVLPVVGLITMVCASLLTLRETDLKRILAYSTISALGIMVLLIGIPHPAANVALLVFLIVHALYKASLFLIAGIIDHETGTRDISQLGALAKKMPLTAIAAVLASLSMAGIPPLFGFIAKELVYEIPFRYPLGNHFLVLMIFTNAVTIVAAGLIALRCFFYKPKADAVDRLLENAHDPDWRMLLGPCLLSGTGLYLGLVPDTIVKILQLCAGLLSTTETKISLHLWHGLTLMLLASISTVLIAIPIFIYWQRIQKTLRSCAFIDNYGSSAAYSVFFNAVLNFAAWQTKKLQTGSLNKYLAVVFTSFSALVISVTLLFEIPSINHTTTDHSIAASRLSILFIISSFAVIRASNFTTGLISAGITGFLMSLLFLFQGAPDLAFTQFSVEALSIIIILAIVNRMPFNETEYRTKREKWRDAVIALSVGGSITLLLILLTSLAFNPEISDFYANSSLSQAYGRNIVNVILVDFRALDTLGEITVLALSALAAAVLIPEALLKKESRTEKKN